jgi:hypothetical protein
MLDVEDFLEVLRCHWVTDTNSFPHERQQVITRTHYKEEAKSYCMHRCFPLADV